MAEPETTERRDDGNGRRLRAAVAFEPSDRAFVEVPGEHEAEAASAAFLRRGQPGGVGVQRLAAAGRIRRAEALLELQRTRGNAYVQRLVADATGKSGRLIGLPQSEMIAEVQRRKNDGAPLPAPARTELEGFFASDLGDVRVHSDPTAADLTTELGAAAFTVGNDVFVAPEHYAPSSESGQALLAHEIRHVAQQNGLGRKVQRFRSDELPSPVDDELRQRVAQPTGPPSAAAAAPAAPAREGGAATAGGSAPHAPEAAPGGAAVSITPGVAAEVPPLGTPVPGPRLPDPALAQPPAQGAAGGAASGEEAAQPEDPRQESALESIRRALASGEPEGAGELRKEETRTEAPTSADVSEQAPADQLKQGGDAALQSLDAVAQQATAQTTPPAEPPAAPEALPTPDTSAAVAAAAEPANQAIAQRDTAVAAAQNSAAQLETIRGAAGELVSNQVALAPAAPTDDLPPEQAAAAEQQRAAASDMVNGFLGNASQRAQQVLDLGTGVPARLQAAADLSVAAISSAVAEGTQAISTHIDGLRAQAAAEAQAARETIEQQHTATSGGVTQATATARQQLESEFNAALRTVDERKAAQLTVVDQRYSEADQRFREAGRIVGAEADARAQQMASAYMEGLVDEDDSFWDGPLTYNRGKARADTAKQYGEGYQKGLIEEAGKQADEAAKGKVRDVESVHTTAGHAVEAMRSQYNAVLATINDAEAAALRQATEARAQLIQSVDQALQGAVQALGQQEVALIQNLRGAAQAQAAAVEEQTAQAIGSLQDQISQVAAGLLQTGAGLAALLQGASAPPVDEFAATLGEAQAQLDTGVADVLAQLEQGQATAEQQMAEAGQTVASGLASSSQTGMDGATAAASDVSSALSSMAGSAAGIFGGIQESHDSTLATATTSASGGFSQALHGVQQSYDTMANGLQEGFARSAAGLEQGLRGAIPKMEGEIREKAEEAASHVPPRWKSIVKWILIIAVIVVVALVIGPFVIGAVGAALGTGAVMTGIIAGAIVGGLTSATIQVINNWAENRPALEGVAKAALIGAIGGAVGGGFGAWVGQLGQQGVSIANGAFRQFALNTAANIVTENAINVATGNFTWQSFGMSVVSAVAVGGAMHAMSGLKPVANLQHGAMEAGGRFGSSLAGTPRVSVRAGATVIGPTDESPHTTVTPTNEAEAPRATAAPGDEAPRPTTAPADEVPRPTTAPTDEGPTPTAAPANEVPEAGTGTSASGAKPDPATPAKELTNAELETATSTTAQVGDEEHVVHAVKKGDQVEVEVCSWACDAARNKIKAIVDELPAGPESEQLRTELNDLKTDVDGIERRIAQGQANSQVADDCGRVARRLQEIGSHESNLGDALNDPSAIAPSTHGEVPSPTGGQGATADRLRAFGAEVGETRTIKATEFGSLAVEPDTELLYVLRDSDGTVLKVGKTAGDTAIDTRFPRYDLAERRLDMGLTLEVTEITPAAGKTLDFYEGQLRAQLEGEGNIMPWDNTGNRLGRGGPGTPYTPIKDEPLLDPLTGETIPSQRDAFMWDREGNLVQRDGSPLPEFVRKNAIPTQEDVVELLGKHSGDVKAIAEATGRSPSTVYRWLREYGLSLDDFR
jgi:Domain of unknown function (DUF4157)